MKWIALLSAVTIVLVGATSVLPSIGPNEVGRQITIVAKDMVFIIESPDSPEQANPSITVKAGQKITIVFRNDDPGMRHDLVIQGMDVHIEAVSCGQTTRLTFTAPRDPSTYVYLCSFHPRRMRGVFVVE